MTTPMIPEAAVEAAARYYREGVGVIPNDAWIRGILEAAAPDIIKAWINDMSRLPNDLLGYGPEGQIK